MANLNSIPIYELNKSILDKPIFKKNRPFNFVE